MASDHPLSFAILTRSPNGAGFLPSMLVDGLSVAGD
jgi:hypothetical protein